MKYPTHRPPRLQGRAFYLACFLGVLALAVLFTLVALLAPEQRGGAQVPYNQPGIEVDVDVAHPHPRHSAQRQRSSEPRLVKGATSPVRQSTPARTR